MNKTLIAVLLLTIALSAMSTPYLTPEQWEAIQSREIIIAPPVLPDYDELLPRLKSLTDEGQAYLFEYIQICDFLTRWQVSNPADPNYGGMIEGETGELVTIIQTDNTQESIRVWSHYAALTGDLERYRSNIDAAWVYTMRFPAYSEEGETDYYRVHNCGWGLAAQIEYQTVYGDTTFRAYADSCADYMSSHPLPFYQGSSYYQQLHPLVEGWAAGTLYLYGQYTGNQNYVDAALNYGQIVKSWLEENPSRLSSNEVWAMSGGTAMWGVVNSLFQENPASGITWLQTYLPYMDIFAGPGQWNNSWNIWYAHAYNSIYQLTSDSLQLANAVFLVDTLLNQDSDNDGGIPAGTVDPDSMDQTWVSCYTNWMGISYILQTIPQIDAGISAFITPQPSIPISVEREICFQVSAINYGSTPQSSVPVSVVIEPELYQMNSFADLSVFALDTVTFPIIQWGLPGFYTLRAFTSLPGDGNHSNDTLALQVEVRVEGTLSGYMTDSVTGEGISAKLLFYHQEVSDEIPYDSTESSSIDGHYAKYLMTGEYRIEVYPTIPYNMAEFIGAEVTGNGTYEYDMALTAAPILLVDDDGGDNFQNYFKSSLDELGWRYYWWDYAQRGQFTGETGLFPIVLWFTGNEDTLTLTMEDKLELEGFLQAGGKLLLTGQNIGDDLGTGDAFMNEYLRADHDTDDMNLYILNGSPNNPISLGTSLFLIGSPGAGNQNSPSSLIPLQGSQVLYQYQNPSEDVGAVIYDNPTYSYSTAYFAFGIEGISGLMNTTPRHQLLSSLLFYWTGTSVEEPPHSLPLQFNLSAPYPNPFNSQTRITYSIASPDMTELAVYNILGQKITVLWNGYQLPGSYSFVWDASDLSSSSSALYFCRLSTADKSQVKKVILIK